VIAIYNEYAPGSEIPILRHLKNRKLAKYLNRESMAAVVAVGELNERAPLTSGVPFYYSTGRLEYEDYGLPAIVAGSRDAAGAFSPGRFVREGIAAVSPLNQFKVLQNMPLSFVSINYGLRGDNAVLYASAAALLAQARCSPSSGPLLLGAGRAHPDGRVESGFALVHESDLEAAPSPAPDEDGLEMLRAWAKVGRR
jgi:hypothetical protein